ncbi:MAG: hypothetical protein IJ634_05080 [Bacteroidales bacterium]|nr:hypothetical protein [Bacteroidales bacterium]
MSGLFATSCGQKAEPAKILRFEQFLFAQQGNAKDFSTPLLNYNPDDPAFMAALNDFLADPMVRHIYAVTDSLYHDLSWLEQDLGDAMARAKELCPEIDYRYFYTLVTADIGNYPNRVFGNLTDMAVCIDNYTLGHVEEMQRFGVPAYIARLCRREYIASDVMAAAARSHIVLPDGDLTFLDHAIAEGKTLYFLDQVLPSTPDTIKLRYSKAQLEWMQENAKNVWGWLIQNKVLFSNDMTQLNNLVDDAPKTNAFGDGSAPRTNAWLGWQIVKQYMKKNGVSMSELFADTDSRKILETSGWRP